MPKIPLYYRNDEFFNEFGTTCYINREDMIDVFPVYRHDFVEVSLILEGEGTEIINDIKYPVSPGCVSVTMPWHFHTLHTRPDRPIKRFICEFSMEDFFNYSVIWPAAKDAVFSRKAPSILLTEEDFNECCSIFNAMYTIFTSEDPDRQTRLYLKLIEFMMLFYRARENLEKEPPVPTNNIIENGLRCIHQHFAETITITSVAHQIGVGVSVLRDNLKAYTGMEFHALLTDIRIRNACILLALKTPTIKYIAQNTGFSSVQNFYRTFKNIKGITPEEFRRQHWMESEGKAGYLMYNNEIWNILYYIYRHFDDPSLTPEEAARAFNISTSHLHKIIKYNFMQTFSELLREIRIGYSCGLLADSDMPVVQIAVECGYNNTKTFTRAFQKQKGCTPSEFRMAGKTEQT